MLGMPGVDCCIDALLVDLSQDESGFGGVLLVAWR
jgi:hypothetical protein